MPTRRALLLIADIGGYTQYMQFHRSMLGHAEAATRRMLDKIVGAARGFDLIEIEGDAAFLSRDADGLDGPATLSAITGAAVAMHRAFHAERRFVELPEYLLVSDDLFRGSDTVSSELDMQEIEQDLEGIGLVPTFFVSIEEI